MMKKFSIIIYQSVLFISLTHQLKAQETLDQYIEYGLKNNTDFINQQLGIDLQNQKYQEAKGKYLPHIYLDASYIRAQGGRTIDVPASDLVNPAYQGLNSILGTDRYPANIENVSEQLLPDDFHETKIRLIQPVLNAKIWLNAKANSLNIELEKAKKDALRNRLISEIKSAYYNYLAANAQSEIYQGNEKLLLQLLAFNQSLVKHDKATSDVVFDTKAQLAEIESQLIRAETSAKNARSYFNYLIGRELAATIYVDSTALGFTADMPNTLQSLTNQYADGRPEIRQLNTSIELTKTKEKLAKSYIIPEVNLIGDIGYQGFGYTFESNQDFYFARVGLTWPIFQGFQNKSKIQQAQILTHQVENQLNDLQREISLQIQQAFYRLNESLSTYGAAKVELTNRQKSFEITNAKYKQGAALPITLESARVNLLTAELKLVAAKYSVLIARVKLEESLNHELNQ